MALLACENLSKADEVPAFFLKIAKNIPRVGRSEGYNDFLKSRRNIPQVSGYNSRAQVLIIETQYLNFILFIPHSRISDFDQTVYWLEYCLVRMFNAFVIVSYIT